MAVGEEPLSHFVKRVHRRMVLLRLLESAGIGLLTGSLLSIALLAILLWRGESGFELALATLALSTLAGPLWIAWRLPTLLDAAAEADRQLNLNDLLPTAWIVRHGDDPMQRAVALMASATIAPISPSTVMLNRLGARTWGGVGLAGALVLAMGLLSLNPLQIQADNPSVAAAQQPASSNERKASPQSSSPGPSKGPRTSLDHPNGVDEPLVDRGTPRTAATVDASSNSKNTNSRSDNGGPGAASSRTKNDSQNQINSTGDSSQPNGNQFASGGGATTRTTNQNSSPTSSGGNSPVNSTGRSPRTDDTPDWSTAAQAAGKAIDAGKLPAEYTDIMRRYFDRY